MRRDRHRRDRTAVMMLRQQPHRERVGIVVVAEVGLLDRDLCSSGFVEQMARKLRAGARQIRPVGAVLPQHIPDPELRAERQPEQQEAPAARRIGIVSSAA